MSDARSLVYRRRICMDSNQPVNQEAAKATDITQAAHRLLFGEAVFQVVHGYYLISNDDAHKLAALHLLSEIGAGRPDPSVRCARQGRVAGSLRLRALCACEPCLCVERNIAGDAAADEPAGGNCVRTCPTTCRRCAR